MGESEEIKATLSDLKIELWLRKRNSDKIVWETKSGDKLSIREMSDTHLVNAIRCLEDVYDRLDLMDCIAEIEDAGDRI